MLFDPWRGPLSTRFAATFVLVAGVGVTLLTRRSIGDRALVSAARWRLVRRGVLLYVIGLLVDEIWPGTILPYYGAMFVLAAGLFTLRIRSLVLVGVTATVGGSGDPSLAIRAESSGPQHRVAHVARRTVGAPSRLRRVRQRDPPVASLAHVPLRRHGARAGPARDVVASRGDSASAASCWSWPGSCRQGFMCRPHAGPTCCSS